MKRIFRLRVRKNGTRVYQLQVKIGAKFLAYARVLLSAWDKTFDITNQEQVISYNNGNMFDLRIINLSWKPKAFLSKKLTDEQQKAIKYIYENNFQHKCVYRFEMSINFDFLLSYLQN